VKVFNYRSHYCGVWAVFLGGSKMAIEKAKARELMGHVGIVNDILLQTDRIFLQCPCPVKTIFHFLFYLSSIFDFVKSSEFGVYFC